MTESQALRQVDRLAAAMLGSDRYAFAGMLSPKVQLVALGRQTDGIGAVGAELASNSLYKRQQWRGAKSAGAFVRLVGDAKQPQADPGLVLTITLEDGLISRIAQQRVPPQAPPEKALKLTSELVQAVNGALVSKTPMLLAYANASGQPVLSYRGSVQTLGDDRLTLWVRNAEGQFLKAIRSHPRVALMLRNEQTRATYQFQGLARESTDTNERDAIYENLPRAEREHDFARTGVAVIVDLDRIEGYAGVGPGGQIDRLLMTRTGSPKQ